MTGQTEDHQPQIHLRHRVFSWPTIIAFFISASFIYFLATRFQVDWDKTWQHIRGLDIRLYFVGLGFYYLSFVFRGFRWQLLARNAGITNSDGTVLPSVFNCSQMIVMGWFVNSVTWMRLGDGYRAYTFSKKSNISFSWSLGTILAERVVDMSAILLLMLIAAPLFSATRGADGTGHIVGAAFLLALALGIMISVMKIYGARAARFLPNRLEASYTRFQDGTLGSLNQRQLPLIFGLGLAGWLLETGRLYFVVHSLEISVAIPLVLIVALGHAILSTVPTPGGVGAVEPGITGLLMMDVAREAAISVVMVDRSITYISIIIIGGISFLIWQFPHHKNDPKIGLGTETTTEEQEITSSADHP